MANSTVRNRTPSYNAASGLGLYCCYDKFGFASVKLAENAADTLIVVTAIIANLCSFDYWYLNKNIVGNGAKVRKEQFPHFRQKTDRDTNLWGTVS